MDDNARPHRTLAVEELLESEDITRMDWPAYSPDLNPIEHVWDALGRRIAARLHHPKNTQQLKQMLIEELVLLPQEMLHQLVLSMRRRCEATIAVRGGDIPYKGTSPCCSSRWIYHHESRYYAFNKACFCLIPYRMHCIPFSAPMLSSSFTYIILSLISEFHVSQMIFREVMAINPPVA
ncbi:transposable element Tc1 transposase [Trichonephila clavipes]|nr:transposable element Tc1 transposase [Trichonephila clavipes]